MRVLVACEFSGIVREAFRKKGHEAISCDLLPSEIPGKHYRGNAYRILDEGFDIMIAHPPCTYLACSGNRSFLNNPVRWQKRLDAVKFVWNLMNANIEKICIENPVGVISSYIRKPDQYIQPYEYGHPESKKTGLWLKNLPALIPTKIVEPIWITRGDGKRYSPQHEMTRDSLKRSITYRGIADAMAEQWG